MNNEERYREALGNVYISIMGGGGMEALKPLNAKLANDIAKMCRLVVVEGKTTKEAIEQINNPKT